MQKQNINKIVTSLTNFKDDWQEVKRILPPVPENRERMRDMFSILFRSKKKGKYSAKR